jgi:acetyl esterase/lipase
MRLNPGLAGSVFLALLFSSVTAPSAQVIPLEPGGTRPDAFDFDPGKTNQDRFIPSSHLGTPALTYFPAPASAAAVASVIICPGGGYVGEAVDKEGYKPALWLNSIGISAFVLRYRLPHGEGGKGLVPPPLEDVQQAIRLVRRNARSWGLDPTRVGVMGWSAGGHLAAMSGTLFHRPRWWDVSPRGTGDRPDFLVLMYPVITMRDVTHKGSRANLIGPDPDESAVKLYSADEQVTSRTPPTFIAVASDDKVVPLENSLLFAAALKAERVPCELAVYEHGGHGFGMGARGTDSTGWPKAFEAWAGSQGLLGR